MSNTFVRCVWAAALLASSVSSVAVQAGELEIPAPRFTLQPEQASADKTDASPAEVTLDRPAPVTFGAQGSKWWTIGAGVANDLSDATDINVHGAYSYFLAEDVEFAGELGLWYYGLEDSSFGVNPNMVFRWHFFNNQKWTVYADMGIGVLLTTDDVPNDGTSFNFTPRAGVGFTRQIGESNTRWQLGLRWAHISNGRMSGDDDNPSRDSVMVYTGVVFPF